jgi:hypothetical protein
MKVSCSRPHLVLIAGLGLGLAPPLAAMPPSMGAGGAVRVRRAREVIVAPLFDAQTRFKVKKSVELRFRAREAISGVPVRPEDISFSLRRAQGGAPIEVPARQVRKGVFAVPFTPASPGGYWLSASIRGMPAGSIPTVHLGVVGLVDGLVEVPPEDDPAVKGAKRQLSSRSR